MLSTAKKSLTRYAQIFDHWILQIAMLCKAEKFWCAARAYLVYRMIQIAMLSSAEKFWARCARIWLLDASNCNA